MPKGSTMPGTGKSSVRAKVRTGTVTQRKPSQAELQAPEVVTYNDPDLEAVVAAKLHPDVYAAAFSFDPDEPTRHQVPKSTEFEYIELPESDTNGEAASIDKEEFEEQDYPHYEDTPDPDERTEYDYDAEYLDNDDFNEDAQSPSGFSPHEPDTLSLNDIRAMNADAKDSEGGEAAGDVQHAQVRAATSGIPKVTAMVADINTVDVTYAVDITKEHVTAYWARMTEAYGKSFTRLRKAVDKWVEGGDIYREAAAAMIEGRPVGTAPDWRHESADEVRARATSLLSAVENSLKTAPQVYRAIEFAGTAADAEKAFVPGSIFRMNMSSFAQTPNKANGFTTTVGLYSVPPGGSVRVTFQVEAGGNGLRLDPLPSTDNPFGRIGEWITGGRYEVSGTPTWADDPVASDIYWGLPILNVPVRQIGSLRDRVAGEPLLVHADPEAHITAYTMK